MGSLHNMSLIGTLSDFFVSCFEHLAFTLDICFYGKEAKKVYLGIHNERIIVSKADDIRIKNPSCPEMVHLLALDVRHSKSRIFGSEMKVVKLEKLNTSILPQILFILWTSQDWKTQFVFLRDFPLKKWNILLASLQPNLFRACTRHSYSASGLRSLTM